MATYKEYFNPGTGEWIQYLTTGAESGGEVVSYRWRSVPGGTIPEHFHPRQEEIFQIESGQAHFTREGEEVVAGPGDTVVIPAGARHSEWNPGNPLQLGVIFWHFRDDIRVSSPPQWLQNLFMPPLSVLGRAVGVKPYYERWNSEED